ncbi:MAG: discoidin domain-containing protein [Verrucomicrobiota bacterium]|jgi:hypothetical protein
MKNKHSMVHRLFAASLLLVFAPLLNSTLQAAAGERGASVTPGVPGPAAAPAPPASTATAPQRPVLASPSGYQTIHNDFLWTDQNGYPIATRSGCMCQFGDQFWWYGGAFPGFDQTCYESTDLVHWTYKGVALRTDVLTDRMDVLYNDTTRQYVMFLKYNGDAAFFGIATATKPEGPFTFKSQTLVDGAKIGDTSMFKDADGKAYLCYVWDNAGPNRQHGIYLMSPDYLTLDKRIYLFDIRSREAPHIFKRNGIYYYGTSRTAGIRSTATTYYTATNLAGPWSPPRVLSTPGSDNSWDTQCDFVFPIQGSQGTVYMYDGDRWIHTAARQGDYLWLPLEFDGDTPILNYYQDWDVNLTTGAWRKFDPARNLALNKTATASSALASNAAANVTAATTYQNYTDFRWESDPGDPQWIMVDLGSPAEINRVTLKWHYNFAKAFKIQLSTDATAWTDVFSTTHGSAYSVTDETFKTTTARYVRMYGTQRGTPNGYSLFTFMVLKD